MGEDTLFSDTVMGACLWKYGTLIVNTSFKTKQKGLSILRKTRLFKR